MDIIKSYSNDSSEEDHVEESNDGVRRNDYLGLLSDDLDDLLDRTVEKDLAGLKASSAIYENSLLLSPFVSGPSGPDKLCSENPGKNSTPRIVRKKESAEEESESSKTEAEDGEPDVSWEEVFGLRVGRDRRCRPPAACAFGKRLSEKCISSVEWNRPFCSLLLTASLDGYLRIWSYASRAVLSARRLHPGGIRAGTWTLDGRATFTAGFDKFSRLTDLVTGREVSSYSHEHLVSSVCCHPSNPNLFLSGTFNRVHAWDVRSPPASPVHTFSANCKQVLCLAFLPNEEEFVCSTEVVSRDSADRTIMAWHLSSGALLSNQIYQERFVCPWLCVDSERNSFLAQSSGNYIAEFCAERPYKMNKYRRYEGHNVSGYSIGCCLSHDSSLLASGDSAGGVCIYRVGSGNLVQRLSGPCGGPSVSLDWHPRLGSLLAVGTWNGSLQFWN